MKKIIISLLIVISFMTGSVFAYNKNIELNTEEYINLINTSISKLNAKTESKEKATIGTILLHGADEGYIIPSIKNDIALKEGITELINNIKDAKIYNKKLQSKHEKFISELNSLTELVNSSIKCKTKILSSKDRNLTKCQRILKEDDKKVQEVNKKIDIVNNLYKEINNFKSSAKNPNM